MKANIHPKYYEDAQVICSCGNTFTTGSTKSKIVVEVCYKCHPFFTGEKRYIDTLGQVDKFQRKEKIAQEYKQKLASKKFKKTEKKQESPKTLKELLSTLA